jgi:hypothetical protein
MKASRHIASIALASVLASGAAFAQITTEGPKKVPNAAAAVAVAEKASLDLIGGESKLAEARPFKATGHGDIWLVISQPVADPKNPSAHKRAIVVQLSSTTGEVLDVSTAE